MPATPITILKFIGPKVLRSSTADKPPNSQGVRLEDNTHDPRTILGLYESVQGNCLGGSHFSKPELPHCRPNSHTILWITKNYHAADLAIQFDVYAPFGSDAADHIGSVRSSFSNGCNRCHQSGGSSSPRSAWSRSVRRRHFVGFTTLSARLVPFDCIEVAEPNLGLILV
jgi:hypothetical protein